VNLNGKLKLYATKTATEQLAQNREITLQIVARETVGEAYVVTCRATMPSGRFTESIGAVSIQGLKGDAFCNMLMKAETKAKRRAVLSLTGLGMLDEMEVEAVAGAQPVALSTPAREQGVIHSEETAKLGTAAQEQIRFKTEAERHTGSELTKKNCGELAVLLLGQMPQKWTAALWAEARKKTDAAWEQALREFAVKNAAQSTAPAPVTSSASEETDDLSDLSDPFEADEGEERETSNTVAAISR
jgi:hypothetical protein